MGLMRQTHPPQIGAVMTPFPYFVSSHDSIEEVERLMSEHGIRHLPVQNGGELVGIISERDLHRLINPALPAVNKKRLRAQAVLLPDPYVVEVDAPLAEVASEMAARHIGSALVMKQGKLAGILSVTDVCRILGELLDEIFPPNDGNEPA